MFFKCENIKKYIYHLLLISFLKLKKQKNVTFNVFFHRESQLCTLKQVHTVKTAGQLYCTKVFEV